MTQKWICNAKPGSFSIRRGAVQGEPKCMDLPNAPSLARLKEMGLVGIYKTDEDMLIDWGPTVKRGPA